MEDYKPYHRSEGRPAAVMEPGGASAHFIDADGEDRRLQRRRQSAASASRVLRGRAAILRIAALETPVRYLLWVMSPSQRLGAPMADCTQP